MRLLPSNTDHKDPIAVGIDFLQIFGLMLTPQVHFHVAGHRFDKQDLETLSELVWENTQELFFPLPEK